MNIPATETPVQPHPCTLLFALCVLVACTEPVGQPIELGTGQTGLDPSTHRTVDELLVTECGDVCDILMGQPRDIEMPPAGGREAEGQLWDGYSVSRKDFFESDRVRMWLTGVDENGPVTGVVRFGDSPLVQQPTSPTDRVFGLPADTHPADLGQTIDGYNYLIEAGQMLDGRLTFHISPIEAMTGWCALQTPMRDCAGGGGDGANRRGTGWSCAPYSDIALRYEFGQSGCTVETAEAGCTFTEVDCTQLTYCTELVCDCDADGCRPASSFGAVEFDLRLDGDALRDGDIYLPRPAAAGK